MSVRKSHVSLHGRYAVSESLGHRGWRSALTFFVRRNMSTITSANLANAIVKLVAADALPALMGNLIMGNLVNRDYEPVLANSGDTVNVPIPPVLVANNIAEGGSGASAESEPR